MKSVHVHPLRWLAFAIRGLAHLMRVWPLLLVLGLMISPIKPYMRWEYTYNIHTRYITHCTYIGLSGLQNYNASGSCPVIKFFDTRQL